MNSLRKTVISVAAIVTAAVLLSLASPKTVHALGEQLVNVENTATHPAIVQEVPHVASRIITLVGSVVSSAYGQPLEQLAPNGTIQADVPFSAPAGQSFVITSVEISPWTNSSTWVNIQGTNNVAVVTGWYGGWTVAGTVTTVFQFPSGVVVGSGSYLYVSGNLASSVILHGYLTAQ
jgi:hypothetical protein